ncbi:venom allergen 3 homolog [Lycorma delicatula]|uniref:venom allergen 3 homolog n=1 Tax=Lycorma delicatula TaxID=130591 RepID=UPI003F516E72
MLYISYFYLRHLCSSLSLLQITIITANRNQRAVLQSTSPIAASFKNWDMELAKIAQRWAMQCIAQRDINRDVERYKVGQNFHFANTNDKEPFNEVGLIEDAVSMWYDEVGLMKRELFEGSGKPAN